MDIQETTFPATTYLTLKRSIPTSHISDKEMYDTAGKKLGQYMAEHSLTPSGPWTVLYFTWDEANQTTDIGIAFPITGLESVENAELSVVGVPESKAIMTVMQGSYDNLGKTHEALVAYSQEHTLEKNPSAPMAIEEYEIGSMSGAAEDTWKTNIYYPHA